MHASVLFPATFFSVHFVDFLFHIYSIYYSLLHFLSSFTKKKPKLFVLPLTQLFYGHLPIQSKKLPNDDNVDHDGLSVSRSATQRWLPFKVGKRRVFASGVDAVDSEIKNILVS